jgi:carbonic anhydrase/acetyltransferase-like protein (isoleucine patch superfamily)
MSFDRSRSRVHATAFLAENAIVMGDVTIGTESSVWYGCVVRGDRASVVIGARCNIQDGAIIHEAPDYPVRIGDDVSLGHGAIVHGATLGDRVLVGIRAVVLNGAMIGSDCVVGAGALVTSGMQVPDGSIVLGLPGRVIRSANEDDLDLIRRTAANYVLLSRRYLADAHAPPTLALFGEPGSNDG